MSGTDPSLDGATRPAFFIGQHDSQRSDTLTDSEYCVVYNSGFNFVTTPITNAFFQKRVFALVAGHLSKQEKPMADPIVTPITTIDTNLLPAHNARSMVAYSSPWIDLCSENALVANVSRQVLNLELAYANFIGIRTLIIPGPRVDNDTSGTSQAIVLFSRAMHEALSIANRVSLVIHMPMYREPGLEEEATTLASLTEWNATPITSVPEWKAITPNEGCNIALFGAWDAWHQIRSFCGYNTRLFVALRVPKMCPEIDLQTRWFAEPVSYFTLNSNIFNHKKVGGHPTLGKYHHDMIGMFMKLKTHPMFILHGDDVGPDLNLPLPCLLPPSSGSSPSQAQSQPAEVEVEEYPSLETAREGQLSSEQKKVVFEKVDPYVSCLRNLQSQLEPYSPLEQNALMTFQDYLQSPLQPLSDNLDSATYEIFEGDPIKYNQYERAITLALSEWSHQRKPSSSPNGAIVIAVAGSGRGPLVTRALAASATTGVAVEVWAVEKNPNAYVYLLRQNETVWHERVTVVKTDMRAWKGPLLNRKAVETEGSDPRYGKVDILVSELLGSFGDNELSPECLDGIQHVLSPQGISIPQSYSAHITPISTPNLHAEIKNRISAEPDAFNTPWVVRLFALDYVVAKGVPGRPRFQKTWDFYHPIPAGMAKNIEIKRSGGSAGGGGGAMTGSSGFNDHNARFCHLTFVCRTRGVIHGIAGYFESVLYEKTVGAKKDPVDKEYDGDDDTVMEKVELSILPGNIDKKNKDMISWFPIFFPLRQPLYYPQDTELEVSMWRQTDDTKVWYEWKVDAFMWTVTPTENSTGDPVRIRIGGSDLNSSRPVACLM